MATVGSLRAFVLDESFAIDGSVGCLASFAGLHLLESRFNIDALLERRFNIDALLNKFNVVCNICWAP